MRWLVRIGILVVVLLGLPILLASCFMDSALSRAASGALGVETSLSVVLRPSGSVVVRGARVANPAGFESDRFLGLRRGRLDLRLASLTQDTIVSPLLRLDGVDLFLERRGATFNHEVILENLRGDESARREEDDGDTRFVIRTLEIRDVVADVSLQDLVPDGGIRRIQVPLIRIENVGGDAGVSTAQLSGIIVKAILGAIARHGVGLPLALTRSLGRGLGGLSGVAFEVGGEVSGHAVGAAGAAAGKTGGALRGLAGALGAEKDK